MCLLFVRAECCHQSLCFISQHESWPSWPAAFLPCPQSSVTPNQRRLNTPKIFLLLTNHSGLSEKPRKLHKSWHGFTLFQQKIYCRSWMHLTHGKKTEKSACMVLCEEEVIQHGGINGHYSLPRCIRFLSQQFVQRLSLTNCTKTFAEQHAATN